VDCAAEYSEDVDEADAAAGRAKLVAQLQLIWSRVLRVAPILPESDFFDLGGDSLLAISLLLEIEQELGIGLPVTTIYDAPTVAEFATLLSEQRKPKFSPLVLLKDGMACSPLFVVHGIGGTVIELAKLGKQVRHDGAVYAIQAKGLDGQDPPIDSIEDMAEYYVRAIREIQPAGPYFLSGYSFGGLVAVEMARRLKHEQQEIGLLLLIDAYAHPNTWPALTRIVVLTRRLLGRCTELAKLPWRATASYAIRKCVETVQHRKYLRRSASTGKTVRRWLRHMTVNLPPELQRVYSASESALDAYVPKFYPDKITFLKAQVTDAVFPPNPMAVWRTLAQEFELHSVPGDHLQLMSVHSASTAARLSECLYRCQGQSRGTTEVSRSWRPRPVLSSLKGKPC
jgi:thioesterase domain-containing protein/acyl carrier protein